eukprot:3026597-Rhodomonas_salina.1
MGGVGVGLGWLCCGWLGGAGGLRWVEEGGGREICRGVSGWEVGSVVSVGGCGWRGGLCCPWEK